MWLLSSVQFSSVTQLCPTLCDPMDCNMPSFPVHHQLPKLAQAHVHRVSDAIQPSHPLLSPSPPAFNLSNESALRYQVANYWSFSFSSVLSMDTQDWSPLGWTGGSPCSPRDSQESSPTPQFKSINSSALNFPYSPTLTSTHDYWKNHSFDQTDFVGKEMSLLFNMLSRLVIAFLPRSKRLLISWLQSPSAVILELPKIKYLTVSIVSPSLCH